MISITYAGAVDTIVTHHLHGDHQGKHQVTCLTRGSVPLPSSSYRGVMNRPSRLPHGTSLHLYGNTDPFNYLSMF